MVIKPGKIVKVQITRGKYDVRQKLFIRNRKALKLKGTVRRGSP